MSIQSLPIDVLWLILRKVIYNFRVENHVLMKRSTDVEGSITNKYVLNDIFGEYVKGLARTCSRFNKLIKSKITIVKSDPEKIRFYFNKGSLLTIY